MKPVVSLKGMRDGIAVDIDEKADFVSIIEMLRLKVSDGKRFFAGANTRVYFKGRELSPEEENTLLGIISNVVGTYVLPEQTDTEITEVITEEPVNIGMELSLAVEYECDATDRASPTPTEEIPAHEDKVKKNFTESNCAFYKNGLRSGQTIRYNGSVVIMGDVNPGSEVVADGNVVILGSLKGLAHAGAAGDETCFVLANTMQPVQLRIATVISSMPKSKQKKQDTNPSYAYVKDGKISIAGL